MSELGRASLRMEGIEVTIKVRPGERPAEVAKRLVGRFNEVLELAREAGARPREEQVGELRARLRQLALFDVKILDDKPER